MKKISLTRGLHTLVDDKDFGWLISRGVWYALVTRGQCYAVREEKFGKTRKMVTMHSLLCVGDGEIDHINGDGLDNRRCNLRRVSHAVNQRNVPGAGVSRISNASWRAYITVDGVQLHLGVYKLKRDAISARTCAEWKYYGLRNKKRVKKVGRVIKNSDGLRRKYGRSGEKYISWSRQGHWCVQIPDANTGGRIRKVRVLLSDAIKLRDDIMKRRSRA